MKRAIAAAALLAAVIGTTAPFAHAAAPADGINVVKHRQAVMKRMGGDLKTIENYGKGKGGQPAAIAAATNVLAELKTVPSLFPPKTGLAEFPGKSGAKPAIWSEWSKFESAQKTTIGQAEHLLAVVKGGDRAAVAAAPGKVWDDGCQTCHKPFRQKI